MTQLNEVYKCNICGNIVEVLHAGVGELVCCGQPMELMSGKTQDEGVEKHLPVIERDKDSVKVKVGSIPHPMKEAHYIEWIELIIGDKIYRELLKPGSLPEAVFSFSAGSNDKLSARAYCNIHGLWKN